MVSRLRLFRMVGEYRDAFRSTAEWYAKFRPAYPPALFDLLRERFSLDGSGRLLDLGCGTGQLANPLAPFFDEVVAMDPEREMLTVGRAAASAGGATNVAWLEGGSSDLERLRGKLGVFRLVVMGNSFHWMDRRETLRTLHEMLLPGAGIAIIGSGGTDSRWTPPETPDVIDATIKKYLGSIRRAGSGTYDVSTERHEESLARSPFATFETHVIPDSHTWTVEGLVGWIRSTSYASAYVLGEWHAAFEADLRAALTPLSRFGPFQQDSNVYALLVRKS